MGKRNYTHGQALLPEIKTMLAEGKTRQTVAAHYGFNGKQVVKRLLRDFLQTQNCAADYEKI